MLTPTTNPVFGYQINGIPTLQRDTHGHATSKRR